MELPVQRWLLTLDMKSFFHLTLKLRLALVDDIEILVAECSTFKAVQTISTIITYMRPNSSWQAIRVEKIYMLTYSLNNVAFGFTYVKPAWITQASELINHIRE